MDRTSHNLGRALPPYRSLVPTGPSRGGTSDAAAGRGAGASSGYSGPSAATAVGSGRTLSSPVLNDVRRHARGHAHAHAHAHTHGRPAPQNIWVRPLAPQLGSRATRSGDVSRILQGLGDAPQGATNGLGLGAQASDMTSAAATPDDGNLPVPSDKAASPVDRDRSSQDADPSSVLAPCRNLTDAFERMYVDQRRDVPTCTTGHGGPGAGTGTEGRDSPQHRARDGRAAAATEPPEDREDVEQTSAAVAGLGGGGGGAEDATPEGGGKGSDAPERTAVDKKGSQDAISPAGVDELDTVGDQHKGRNPPQQIARQPSQECDTTAVKELNGGHDAPHKAASSATPSGQTTFQKLTRRPPAQDDAGALAGTHPSPHFFSLVPALMLDLPQPVINRVSFYSVVHDINKEAQGMAANDHSAYSRGVSATGSDGGGGEPPKDEENHPLVVAVNGPPPPISSRNGTATTPPPSKTKASSSFVSAAVIDEEEWLLSAIAARLPEEIADRACPSTFAEAIGEQEAGEGVEAHGGGGNGTKAHGNGQTANPLSSLMNSRTQLWKPSRSWWEAKSGKNPWIEPNSHNKRWRYLWPLIHYHKFLARCIKKLKRNGVDVKVSLSPVSAFLREEVCAVSDHLAAASKFTADEWMAALAPFNGWTDQTSQADANLRELVVRQKLRAFDEPCDVDSPLLRSQIDEQFLRAMAAQREQMANGGLQHEGGGNKNSEGGRLPASRPPSGRYGHGIPPPHARPPVYGMHQFPHQSHAYGGPPLHPGMDQSNQRGAGRKNRKQRRDLIAGRAGGHPAGSGWNNHIHPLPAFGGHGHGIAHGMYQPQQYGHHLAGGYGTYGGQYFPPATAYSHHHPSANAMSHGNFYPHHHEGGYHSHEAYNNPNSFANGHQTNHLWSERQPDLVALQYGGVNHNQNTSENFNPPGAGTPPGMPGTPVQMPSNADSSLTQQDTAIGQDLSVDVGQSSFKSPNEAPPPSPFWGHLNLGSMPGLDTPMTHATPAAKRGGRKGRDFNASYGSDHHDVQPLGLGLSYHTYRHGFAPPSPATQFQQSDSSSGWAHQPYPVYGVESGAAGNQNAHSVQQQYQSSDSFAENEFTNQNGFPIKGTNDHDATDSQLSSSVDVPAPPEVRKVASVDGGSPVPSSESVAAISEP